MIVKYWTQTFIFLEPITSHVSVNQYKYQLTCTCASCKSNCMLVRSFKTVGPRATRSVVHADQRYLTTKCGRVRVLLDFCFWRIVTFFAQLLCCLLASFSKNITYFLGGTTTYSGLCSPAHTCSNLFVRILSHFPYVRSF